MSQPYPEEMNFKTSIFFVLLSIPFAHQAFSQDEFFHELSLEKRFIENEKWELTGEVDWKNLYNELGWRRWGSSLFAVKK